MSNERITLGKEGEAAALSYLKSRGYLILETNYRTKLSEIDIIAQEKDTICFVEVKTRQTLKKGLPREAVTRTKQRKIMLGATIYLQKTRQHNVRVRFDVIEVIKKNKTFDINQIKHAFES